MFDEVSKVFSRGFIVGFFLPGMLFILGNVLLFNVFFPQSVPNIQESLNDFTNIGYGPALIIASWILGVALLAINRILIRILEGYHLLERTRLLQQQQKRFDALNKKIEEVTETGKREKKEFGDALAGTKQLFKELSLTRVSNFPMSRDSVLATSFGNTIRAFEEYSHTVYKIDAVVVWPRIIAVVPEEYRSTIGDAKSQVDSAVNIFYLVILLGIESIVMALLARINTLLWLIFLGLCIVLAVLSYQVAISASRQWGDTVKSVFDLYRYDLLKKVGVRPGVTWQDELDQWELLNKSFLYHYPLSKLARTEHKASEQNSEEGGKSA